MKDQLLKLRLGEEDDMSEGGGGEKGEEGRQVKSCTHLYLSLSVSLGCQFVLAPSTQEVLFFEIVNIREPSLDGQIEGIIEHWKAISQMEFDRTMWPKNVNIN